MQWFYNLKIASKLILGFVIVALIAGVVGVVGLINLNNMNEADTLLYEENALGLAYSGTAATYYQRLRYNLAEMALLEDDSLHEEFVDKYNTFMATIDDCLTKYGEGIINEDDRKQYDVLMPEWEKYKTIVQKAVELSKAGQYNQIDRLLLEDAKDVSTSLQDYLTKLTEYNALSAKERSDSNTQLSKTASFIMIIVVIVGVLIAISLGIFISRIISKPVNKMVAVADKLAAGDVNVNIDVNTKDEVGKLAKSFSSLIASTRDQAVVVERIASKDLTVEADIRSENDLLGKKLSELLHGLNEMITNIAASSEQVAAGSKQVSDSSMALSQGATEQASSIEELTASLEEISSQTKLNAENANKANELAGDAKTNAVQGNSQMKEMLKAMDEINVSSSNIYKIIKVIDDIAFQTNILALNAAVEAARAGQHGKGFAVVAEEVRTLAARSANAAKETTDMIEGSIKKVEDGTKIAKATADALSEIVTGIQKVANLVNDIAVASNEQATGIGQINQGIMQVSQVVQSNSATSEESAAASEELSSQAALLREMVSDFNLKKINKSYDRLEDISPDVLKMLESMTEKRKSDLRAMGEGNNQAAVAKEKKIILSDREFGKY